MEKRTPPYVLWLPLEGGSLVCLSFADGSMSEPFSSVKEATTELLAAVEGDKVTVLQAELLESLIKVHEFSSHSYHPKPILVRDGKMEEEIETILAGLSEYFNGHTLH